jgi:hypothetical protein
LPGRDLHETGTDVIASLARKVNGMAGRALVVLQISAPPDHDFRVGGGPGPPAAGVRGRFSALEPIAAEPSDRPDA